MYFILGMIRSIILYFGLVSAIKGLSFETLLLYLAAVAVHTVFCKLAKDNRSTGEIIFSILGHDTVAPFLGVKTLAEFLLRKYVFNRNEPHAALFLSQNITEAVWGTLLAIYLVTAVL